jgi:Cellulase (glycosyl hydrolase family 5)
MILKNRRTFVLGTVAAGLKSLIPSVARAAVWQDNSRTMRGLNILQPFGWVVGTRGRYAFHPYTNGGPFSDIMPEERRALIRSTGFDFVRMTVDFGPLLSAADAPTLDRLINEIMTGVDLYLASGLKVLIVNFSAADLSVWPTLTDGVAGPAFQRLVTVWKRLAAIVAGRTIPAQVAVELYNEPPLAEQIRTDPWMIQQKYLFDQVRAALPAHTIVVTADSFSGIDRLVLLNPTDYDFNTSFKFSGYEPLVLSHQGEGYWKYVHGLTFPPQEHPGGKPRAISDFAAAVNADNSLWFFEKMRTIYKFTKSRANEAIDTYFDRPCDTNFIAARIEVVTDWAEIHNVSARRLIVGEFGARGDYESTRVDGSAMIVEAGTVATQDNFYEAWRLKIEEARLGAWCAQEINGPAGWSIALGKPPWTFRPDLLAALGMNN